MQKDLQVSGLVGMVIICVNDFVHLYLVHDNSTNLKKNLHCILRCPNNSVVFLIELQFIVITWILSPSMYWCLVRVYFRGNLYLKSWQGWLQLLGVIFNYLSNFQNLPTIIRISLVTRLPSMIKLFCIPYIWDHFTAWWEVYYVMTFL